MRGRPLLWYPRFQILADLKIMDGGAEEARIGYEAGTDIVTVLEAAGRIPVTCRNARAVTR
jgi:3-keto-L-gulonate-6-phosphate decarboxylase